MAKPEKQRYYNMEEQEGKKVKRDWLMLVLAILLLLILLLLLWKVSHFLSFSDHYDFSSGVIEGNVLIIGAGQDSDITGRDGKVYDKGSKDGRGHSGDWDEGDDNPDDWDDDHGGYIPGRDTGGGENDEPEEESEPEEYVTLTNFNKNVTMPFKWATNEPGDKFFLPGDTKAGTYIVSVKHKQPTTLRLGFSKNDSKFPAEIAEVFDMKVYVNGESSPSFEGKLGDLMSKEFTYSLDSSNATDSVTYKIVAAVSKDLSEDYEKDKLPDGKHKFQGRNIKFNMRWSLI